jgi:hypothetical protein
MSYNYPKAYKNNGDTKARGLQELYWTKLLTLSRIQVKICLPPSRPSLTSYALETRGALRMIRVSVFFKWLIPQGGGLGSPYIAQRVQREPLDQTDLRNSVDATLGCGGGTFQKIEARGHQGVPASMGVGPAGPTWRPLGPCLGVVSSRTFPCICCRIIPWFHLMNMSPLMVF